MIYFQDLISKLSDYWAKNGCAVLQPYDIEVGAGTFHPATFFGSLGSKDWNVAYVQPTRRPTDGRAGDRGEEVCGEEACGQETDCQEAGRQETSDQEAGSALDAASHYRHDVGSRRGDRPGGG